MTAHRRRQHRRTGRTLHLVDVENLAAGSCATAQEVCAALDGYRATITVEEQDHVVIASGQALAFAAKDAWPQARLVVGHGVDGADRALLAATDPAFVARRFDRVVVASGDHAFCGLVSALRARHVAVVVASRPEAISGALKQLTLWRPLGSVG